MFNDETWPGPNACDVSIAGSLQDLQPKLRRWKSIMAGNDPNSVEKQIELITWNDSIYRSYNEALRIASNRKGSYAPAPSLAEMVHDAFAVRQMMAVRRLLEQRRDEKKRVYSVRTVLHEIKDNRRLITRENYVCYDGTKYSYDPFHNDWRAAHASEVRHSVFDSLSGKTSTNRTRSDLIEGDLFDTLETQLRKDQLLQTYINKYVAHGADPNNRSRIDLGRHRITLLHLQKLYKLVIWASNTIGKMIDQLVLTEVSTPNFDQFERWDKPLMRDTDKVKLARYWINRMDLYRKWSQQYWNSAILCKKP